MTQANNHPDSSLSFQEKLGVFISYPREGAIITNAIQNALVDLDRTRIDVFVDTVAIPMGEEIGPYIMTALDKAHWFIGVDTETLREAFSWCGLELGVYTENKRKSDSLAQSKILCIYDGTPPDLFKNRQQVQVVSLEAKHQQDLTERIYSVDEAPLNALFVQFADYYHDFYKIVPDMAQYKFIKSWAEKATKDVTEAYWRSLQTRVRNTWYPQKRIEIRIEDGDFWRKPIPAIPDEADVDVEAPTYAVFRLAVPAGNTRGKVKWKEFCEQIQQQSGGRNLIEMIEDIINSVMPNRDEAHNDYTFVAPNGSNYRVILVRHQMFRNGRRDFIINFIETVKQDYGGDPRTTLLTAGIMLASKFRFLFLEEGSGYTDEKFSVMANEDLISAARGLIKTLQRIHVEAADQGLSDIKVLQKLLKNKDQVTRMFEEWWGGVRGLEACTVALLQNMNETTRDAYIRSVQQLQAIGRKHNARFISSCLERYQQIVEEGGDAEGFLHDTHRSRSAMPVKTKPPLEPPTQISGSRSISPSASG